MLSRKQCGTFLDASEECDLPLAVSKNPHHLGEAPGMENPLKQFWKSTAGGPRGSQGQRSDWGDKVTFKSREDSH